MNKNNFIINNLVYPNFCTSQFGYTLRDIKMLYAAFSESNAWKRFIHIYKRNKRKYRRTYSNYIRLFDKINYYLEWRISGISTFLSKISLEELVSKEEITNTLLKKIIACKKCKWVQKNYPIAKDLYLNGRVEFIDLFGKERFIIPNSKELYELIKSEYFLSNHIRGLNGNTYKDSNIATVFNYYGHLFNNEICEYILSIKDNFSSDILKRFKREFKNNPSVYDKLSPESKLLFEIGAI